MRTHVLVATPVNGPLTADQLTVILSSFRSVHQFQPFDQFSVVFISETLVLQLDRGAMESIIDYLAVSEPNCRKTAFITRITNNLAVRPRPEPEVLAAASKLSESESESDPELEIPFDEPQAKYLARVRFNLLNGRRIEEMRAVNSLSELDWLLDRGPYDDTIKNIKIKLEFPR
jgi:hypothetical protein